MIEVVELDQIDVHVMRETAEDYLERWGDDSRDRWQRRLAVGSPVRLTHVGPQMEAVEDGYVLRFREHVSQQFATPRELLRAVVEEVIEWEQSR